MKKARLVATAWTAFKHFKPDKYFNINGAKLPGINTNKIANKGLT